MASPPPPINTATSPPLALPRQRPTLALPGHSHHHHQSRKPSITSAASTPSAHPLRQTSFPPPDSLEAQHHAAEEAAAAALRLQQYSPSQASLDFSFDVNDEFSDSEIVSAISGPVAGDGGDGSTGVEDGGGGGGSAGGGGVTRKRKRGEKKPRGRPAKAPSISHSQSQHDMRTSSVSLVNGEAGGGPSGRGRGATADADNEDEDDDDDDDDDDEPTTGAGGGAAGGRAPLYEGGQLTLLEQTAEKEAKSRFRHYMEYLDELPLVASPTTTTTSSLPSRAGLTTRDMSDRYDVYQRARLRSNDLRKLVNQTLSQSVPANVVTVVSAYAKMFAGMIVEEARVVQGEWMGMERERADGGKNAVFGRLEVTERLLRGEEEDGENGEGEGDDGMGGEDAVVGVAEKVNTSSSPPPPATENNDGPSIKPEQTSSSPNTLSDQPQSQSKTQDPSPIYPGGAGGLQPSILECDRGPLLPDHLREALRRYKKARNGGTVGFTGISLEGREVGASRMGGRRLFR